ncbi:MAG: glycosyl hydrolase [Lentilactobacillus diolivorans]|uniref:glycosyl hydrolase n=1 Tax=Lentilactobacillus diolivorans TaxID=179838 RepID=UPI0039ED98D6
MNTTSFTVDGDQLDLMDSDAHTFKGLGWVSCNNSSRLLMDYKAEQPATYQAILKLVFGGQHPLARMLKIEMGSDANTSSGTEPATIRHSGEEADVFRGAGFQLIADAKKIQPNLKTGLLRWGEPGFLRPLWQNITTDNPDHDVPEEAYEPMYQWYKKTIVAAYCKFGYLFDYIDPDRNETKHPMLTWIKWFGNRLRTDQTGFPEDFPVDRYHQIKLIAADQIYHTDFGNSVLKDPVLRKSLAAVGDHYNTDDGPNKPFSKLADQYQMEAWYSEGIAPMSSGKYRVRASAQTGIGGRQSGLDIANRIIKSYVNSRCSFYLIDTIVSAYYPGVKFSHKELIHANRPWSGYFEVDNVGLQILKHFTDFAKTGWYREDAWRILTSACDSGVGGTENLDTHTEAPSYMTLMAPDRQNYSIIFVNDSDQPRTYRLTLQHLTGCDQKDVTLWETSGPTKVNDPYDQNLKRPIKKIQPHNQALEILIKPHSILTATTLDLSKNDVMYDTPVTSLKPDHILDLKPAKDESILYQDDFDYSQEYLAERGGAPRYTTDQSGAFEVVRDENQHAVLQQMITEKERPLDWEYSFDPNMTLGDDHWRDYEVGIQVHFDNQTNQNTPSGNYVGIGLNEMIDKTGRLEDAPYVFRLTSNGGCELLKDNQVVQADYLSHFVLDDWHQVTFSAFGNHLQARVDQQRVFDWYDDHNPSFGGRIKVGTGYYHTQFRNLEIRKMARNSPLVTQHLDDLDARVTYQGAWQHQVGMSDTFWNRTVSIGETAPADTPATIDFDFSGSGFSLIGRQKTPSVLNVTIDDTINHWNLRPQKGHDKSANLTIDQLKDGQHHATIHLISGQYILDAIEWLTCEMPNDDLH